MEKNITSQEPNVSENIILNKTKKVLKQENGIRVKSNVISSIKLSELYLLPPFENPTDQIQFETSDGFTRYFQKTDKNTGKISLLVTGGHWELTDYSETSGFGSDAVGFQNFGHASLSHSLRMLPLSERLKLIVRIKPVLPMHSDLNEVFRIINEPHNGDIFGAEGKLTFTAHGSIEGNDSWSNTKDYDFLKVVRNSESASSFYNPTPEVKLEFDLLENTDKISFKINFDFKCIVPYNYSDEIPGHPLTGRNYTMIDFRENESITGHQILPGYFFPYEDKPAPGNILVPNIKCEFWRYISSDIPSVDRSHDHSRD